MKIVPYIYVFLDMFCFLGANIFYTSIWKTLCVFPGFPTVSGPSRSCPANQKAHIWNFSKYCKLAPCASNHLQMCNVFVLCTSRRLNMSWKCLVYCAHLEGVCIYISRPDVFRCYALVLRKVTREILTLQSFVLKGFLVSGVSTTTPPCHFL